jgi:mannan endo-1,4-beta-mannosidase
MRKISRKDMRKILCGHVLALILALLTGCNDIRFATSDGAKQDSDGGLGESTAITREPAPVFNGEHTAARFSVASQSYSDNIQAEDIFERRAYDGLSGYEGTGYIQLDTGDSASCSVNLPSSQHYLIGLRICAQDAAVELAVNGQTQGVFYAKEAVSFAMFYLDGLFFSGGRSELTFTNLRGIAYIDEIQIHNAFAAPNTRYVASTTPANASATNATRALKSFLVENYGAKILTGQNVTVNTDFEIDAIFNAVGRYPAVRASDLKYYSRYYQGGERSKNQDIELALKYHDEGGIISYSWSWYAPNPTGTVHFDANKTDFNINSAFTTDDVSVYDQETLSRLLSDGVINRECYEIILDLDDMAAHLKRFADADVPILFRPLMDGGVKGYYWWNEGAPDSYIWLWQMMFKRFTVYHKLNNLIWVYSGEDESFYPGDDYVDIIASDIYNTGESSNITRFFRTGSYGNKLTAMSECALLPDPDILNRDNVMWSWFALYRGDYLVDKYGVIANRYNTVERLEKVYKHELTLTREEITGLF